MSRPTRDRPLSHPLYWPTWGLIGVMRLITLCPWWITAALGRLLGLFVFYFVPIRRRITLINLRLAFPQLAPSERWRLARLHYMSFGRGLFETCWAWWKHVSRYPTYRIEGLENLTKAQAEGGVLLLTAHYTTLELCGRMLTDQFRIGALYRDPDNPVIAHVMRKTREENTTLSLPVDDLRGLVRALREGHAVWYAPDQAKLNKLATIAPFFGEPAVTTTATSEIARMGRAKVVPYFGRRLSCGRYLITLEPALEGFPSGNAQADAERINSLIESQIRQAPEQYFWLHKRYKYRGPDYPDAYARS